MLISEQIKKLQELKDNHGDVEVYTYLPYEQCYVKVYNCEFEPASRENVSMFGTSEEDIPDRILLFLT